MKNSTQKWFILICVSIASLVNGMTKDTDANLKQSLVQIAQSGDRARLYSQVQSLDVQKLQRLLTDYLMEKYAPSAGPVKLAPKTMPVAAPVKPAAQTSNSGEIGALAGYYSFSDKKYNFASDDAVDKILNLLSIATNKKIKLVQSASDLNNLGKVIIFWNADGRIADNMLLLQYPFEIVKNVKQKYLVNMRKAFEPNAAQDEFKILKGASKMIDGKFPTTVPSINLVSSIRTGELFDLPSNDQELSLLENALI